MRQARLALLALGSAAAGQVQALQVPAFAGQSRDRQVVVDVVPVLAAHDRPGPAGFVTCTVENPDEAARAAALRIGDWWGRVHVHDTLRLEPGQRVVRHYPVQRFGQAVTLRAQVDDGPVVQSNSFGVKAAAVAVLYVTAHAESVGLLQTALASAFPPPPPAPVRTRVVRTRGAPGETAGIAHVQPHALPGEWQCYAGFDLLVVDGRARLDPAGERALADAVAAGGRLFVPWGEELSDGPLRRAVAERREGDFAFGRFLVVPGEPGEAVLSRWLRAADVDGAAARIASGPAHDWLHAALRIPGLGEVPVLAFFLLLTAFVVLAGPVNIFLCRRAGRPLLVAFTLPALGLGFAVAILAWGVLAEGLGLRGCVRSLTWLDQRTRLSVNHAGASFYPGLTPSALHPMPATAVTSLSLAGGMRDDTPHRLVVDHAAGGRIAGSLLPARWQTHLVTVSVRQARERLRFRRLGDGTLEALFDRDLVPAAPGIAVRDHAGRYWLGAPQGDRVVLQPSDGRAVRAFLHEGRTALQDVPAAVNEHELRYAAVHPTGRGSPPQTFAADVLRLLRDLEPGTWAGWLAANAAFDQLGLEVSWEERRHLVLGLLAEEDFVD